MAENGISCISTRPTPPHTNPMESGPETLFRLKIKKTKRFTIFDPKNHCEMRLLDKVMSLQGVKLTTNSSHSAPYKPHGVETRKHFSKKNQKIHDFRPKKGVAVIF